MINSFIEDKNVNDLSYMFLEAFEDYHNHNRLDKVQELFGNYFSPINKWYDFMEQIKHNFIADLEPLKLKILSDAIYKSLVLYKPEKYNKNTLLSILELAVYAKTSVYQPIIEIWKILEHEGFGNKEQIEYVLNILKYMAGLIPDKDAYHFFTRIASMKDIPYEFMPLTLMVKSHESIDNLPLYLNKFSNLKWLYKEKEHELKFMIENLIIKLGLEQIVNQLSFLEPQAYWFVEKLFESPRVKLSYQENGIYHCIDNIENQEIDIQISDTEYKYDFMNLLDKLYKFSDDFDDETIKEVGYGILDKLNSFSQSSKINEGIAA